MDLPPSCAEFPYFGDKDVRTSLGSADMVTRHRRTVLFNYPLLIWLIPVRKLPHLLVSLILSVPLFRLYLYCCHPTVFTYVLLPCRADALLSGILCAYCVRNEATRRWLDRKRSWFGPALVILLVGAGYLTAAVAHNSFAGFSFDIVFWGYTWIALLYACLLLFVVTAKRGAIGAIMRFKPLRHLGTISYSFYLMHMAILSIIFDLILGKKPYLSNFQTAGVTVVALLATLLLATLSWRFFEKPIIRWGLSFAYGNGSSTPMLSDAPGDTPLTKPISK